MSPPPSPSAVGSRRQPRPSPPPPPCGSHAAWLTAAASVHVAIAIVVQRDMAHAIATSVSPAARCRRQRRDGHHTPRRRLTTVAASPSHADAAASSSPQQRRHAIAPSPPREFFRRDAPPLSRARRQVESPRRRCLSSDLATRGPDPPPGRPDPHPAWIHPPALGHAQRASCHLPCRGDAPPSARFLHRRLPGRPHGFRRRAPVAGGVGRGWRGRLGFRS